MTLAQGTDTIESERLVLSRITMNDLDFYTRIQSDPEVARFIGSGKPRTAQESRNWLEAVLASYASAQLGQLAVRRKSDSALVGRCGLSDAVVEAVSAPGAVPKGWFFRAQAPQDIAIESVPELGYTFAKEHWGQGYASEAAGCVYRYVRSARELGKIMSVIGAGNLASLAVARKFGVRPAGQIELMGNPFDRYDWP